MRDCSLDFTKTSLLVIDDHTHVSVLYVCYAAVSLVTHHTTLLPDRLCTTLRPSISCVRGLLQTKGTAPTTLTYTRKCRSFFFSVVLVLFLTLSSTCRSRVVLYFDGSDKLVVSASDDNCLLIDRQVGDGRWWSVLPVLSSGSTVSLSLSLPFAE
jgi:hypothetical protein